MNKLLLHKEIIESESVAGTLSENTVDIKGIIKQIVVSPATDTTSYEISIADADGLTVFETDTETGNYCELTDLPISGVYTITISSATRDEAFSIRLIVNV